MKSPKEIWIDAHDEVLDTLGLTSLNEVKGDARDDVEVLIEQKYQELISDLIDNTYDRDSS